MEIDENVIFSKYQEMLIKWKKTEQEIESIWHMRIATSGLVDESMCHPLTVDQELEEVEQPDTKKPLLFHNGIIGSPEGN